MISELWLQPKESAQGSKPVKIILGSARGNTKLSCEGRDWSNRLLAVGTMYGDNSRLFEKEQSTQWSQAFHLYKVTWTTSKLFF